MRARQILDCLNSVFVVNASVRKYYLSPISRDTSVENLRFLSSQQAIEDIADFVRKISADKGGDQKWIIIGGSYAGERFLWES